MIEYRITKYNPDFRNKGGYYTDSYSDWTSSSEIGKVFNDKELTFLEYLEVENKYVEAIKQILSEFEIKKLRVINLSNHSYKLSKNELDVSSKILYEKFENIREDEVVELELIEVLIKANLREFVYCKLFHEKITIKFGYDYYMYVISSKELKNSANTISDFGLFVENLGNLSFKETKRIIVSSLKGEEELSPEISIDISGIPIIELRKIFNFSDEHPMDGFYNIDSTIAKKLEKIIKYRFEFDKYEYYLETQTD